MSVNDFAKWAGIGRTTAWKEIREGRLRAVKVSTRTVVAVEDARQWLATRPALSPFSRTTPGPSMKKCRHPLFYDNDSIELRANILRLVKLRYFVKRCSPHHLRIERVNFWPTTGTIHVDGEAPRHDRGWDALIALLTAVCPKPAYQRSKPHRVLARPDLESRSPIDLVDNDVLRVDLSGSVTTPTEEDPTEIAIVLSED